MKILTFRRLVGIAAIGGLAYVHRQRGGEWTLDSMGDTLRSLWSSATGPASTRKPVQENPRETLDQAAHVSESGSRGVSGEPRSRS